MTTTEAELLREAGLPEDRQKVIGKRFFFRCVGERHEGKTIFGFVEDVAKISVLYNGIILRLKNPTRFEGHNVQLLAYFGGRWRLDLENAPSLYGKLSLRS